MGLTLSLPPLFLVLLSWVSRRLALLHYVCLSRTPHHSTRHDDTRMELRFTVFT